MIKSMTGFGRSEISEGKRKISVEMKSVNHRYLEAGIKMPKKLNIFEARIRDLLKRLTFSLPMKTFPKPMSI